MAFNKLKCKIICNYLTKNPKAINNVVAELPLNFQEMFFENYYNKVVSNPTAKSEIDNLVATKLAQKQAELDKIAAEQRAKEDFVKQDEQVNAILSIIPNLTYVGPASSEDYTGVAMKCMISMSKKFVDCEDHNPFEDGFIWFSTKNVGLRYENGISIVIPSNDVVIRVIRDALDKQRNILNAKMIHADCEKLKKMAKIAQNTK